MANSLHSYRIHSDVFKVLIYSDQQPQTNKYFIKNDTSKTLKPAFYILNEQLTKRVNYSIRKSTLWFL